MRVVMGGGANTAGGIPHGALLAAFAEAAVTGDDAALERTRAQILAELGAEALVDSAALIGHYEKVDRIADATGIPLDTPMQLLGGDLQAKLGLDGFASARNTKPQGAVKRALGRVIRLAAPTLIKALSAAKKPSPKP